MKRYEDTVTNEALTAIVGATVAVRKQDGTLSTIYSDNGVTTKGNPTTTDSNGMFFFYAADGTYDIEISATSYSSATVENIVLNDGGISSLAELRAINVEEDTDYKIILGHTTPGDGGGGTFYWNASSADADDNGITILPTGHVGNGRWKREYSGPINIKWYGAGIGGYDSGKIQAAINAVAAIGSGSVYIPAGTYSCPNSGDSQLRIKSDIRILGDGMHNSILNFNDSVSVSRRDLLVTDSTGAFDIEIEGIGLNGDWGTVNYTYRSHLMELSTTGNVTIKNCRFSNGRYMACVVTGGAKKVMITGCEFYRMVADGARATNVDTAIISDNYFESVNDDSIAVHTKDDEPFPVQSTATITGNRIVDSQGIACLGIKDVTISGNSLTRVHTRAIAVGTSTTGTVEGNTATVGISITGNVIDTVFQGTAFFAGSGGTADAIVIYSKTPTTNGSGYVGQPDGSGGIVSPFDYFYTNDTDLTGPSAGSWFINISGNTVIRTLAPVANYSDYGFGERYGRGGPVNPAITSAILGYTSGYSSIRILNHAQSLNIFGNVLWGAEYGVHLDGDASSAYLSWRDVLISNNVIANFNGSGVYAEGEGDANIKNCVFNGDPLHVNAQRVANGKWDSGYGVHTAFWVAGMNISVTDCTFKNMGDVFRGTSESHHAWKGNIMYCNPTAIGYHADNIGIARVNYPSLLGATVVIEDGDPASATYGTILNLCPTAATAVPSSGKFVIGHFVTNVTPAIDGNNLTILGWIRLTTGSNHASGTDWAISRVSHVSPAT